MTQKRTPGRTSRPKTIPSNRAGGAYRTAPLSPTSNRGPTTNRGPTAKRAGSKRPPPKRSRTTSAAAAPKAPPPAPVAPELSEKQRRHLRGLAHELNPIIRLGNAGLTEAVAIETARALQDHELIKVKAPGGGDDREARDALFTELAKRTASALIVRIGNVAVLYRPNAKLPKILIPDAAPQPRSRPGPADTSKVRGRP